MNKEELIAAVADIRAAWDTTIADLGRDGLERPGATGEWRVRDVIAHFNGWDRWQLVQLRCAFTGDVPTVGDLTGGIRYPPNDDMQQDAVNAMMIAGTRDLPLDDIIDHWREVSAMRTAWVTAASQEMLDEVLGADWTSGSVRIFRLASEFPSVSTPERVWERIFDQVEHQLLHLDIVRDWMR